MLINAIAPPVYKKTFINKSLSSIDTKERKTGRQMGSVNLSPSLMTYGSTNGLITNEQPNTTKTIKYVKTISPNLRRINIGKASNTNKADATTLNLDAVSIDTIPASPSKSCTTVRNGWIVTHNDKTKSFLLNFQAAITKEIREYNHLSSPDKIIIATAKKMSEKPLMIQCCYRFLNIGQIIKFVIVCVLNL